MAPTPETNNPENSVDKKGLEEKDVIDESREKQKSLKSEIMLKRSFSKINFHLDTTSTTADWASIISKLKEKYNNDNSLEWALLGNPQIQNLLWNAVSWHAKSWNKLKIKHTLNNKDNKEDKNEEEKVEKWEDFELRESSPEKFEEWLLSVQWINALRNEIEDHLDENWNLIEGYSINEKDLRLSLEKTRYINLLGNYNLKYKIFDNEEKKYMKDMWFLVHDEITSIVKKQLISKWSFDKWMIKNLELLLANQNTELAKKIKENPNIKDEFKRVLKGTITKYSNYVIWENKVDLNTWTPKQDLLLRSYLFIYWKSFFPDTFKLNENSVSFDNELTEVMEAILIYDWELGQVKYNKYLNEEKKAEEDRKKRDSQRRQEAAKRNRENDNAYNDEKWNWWQTSGWNTIHGDINWATWAQIVRNSDVNLSDFKVNNWNMEMYAKSWYAKQKAFWIAWKNFKESNRDIDDVFSPEDMRKLYNTSTNSIDENARKEFLKSDIMQWRSEEEINRIYNALKTFPNKYSDALKLIASKVQNQEKWIDNEIRNHALWSVIDNVRFVFADIVEKWKWDSKFEWFKFDWFEPVKREWNDIIISGTFNWTAIKIRYDLISWGLFMNSFLQHPSNSKISIWNNSSANLKIWQLESFDSILYEHYRTPDISLSRWSQSQSKWHQAAPNQWLWTIQWPDEWSNQWWDLLEDSDNNDNKRNAIIKSFANKIHHDETAPVIEPTVTSTPISNSSQPQSFSSWSEIKKQNTGEIDAIRKKYKDMLYANLDMISNAIVDNTKKQSARNTTVTKFMKTFNIMLDDQEDRTLDFNDGSNLFDLLQIIENSDSAVLEKFQIFMEKISDFSGLKRWNNNIFWAQKDFNKIKKNKYSLMIIDNAKKFSEKPWIYKGKMNFDSDSQLWFAQMIIENITNNVSKPNWKLDSSKIDNFIYHLENDWENS